MQLRLEEGQGVLYATAAWGIGLLLVATPLVEMILIGLIHLMPECAGSGDGLAG